MMTVSKRPVRATLLLLRILIILILSCFYGNEATNCIENEKQALLTFKQDLTDPSNRLSSWIDGVDCCEWFGVVCNNITAHVTELNLKNPDPDPDRTNSTLGGSLNPSLLHLQQLQVLDLSFNNFSGVRIPSFIGSIHSLRHLNLSDARFQGVIPHQLGNLSNLRSVSVGSEYFYDYSKPKVDNIQWLAGLSNLERLDMSGVNLSEASNWLQVINMIPSLTQLHLSWCSLSQISHTIDLNLSSLTILDLSRNEFTSSIPRWIFDLRKLVSLDLRGNDFEGPMPEGLRNLTSLNHLDMSSVNLSEASNWLQVINMIPSLTELHLSGCSLSQIPHTIDLNLSSLTVLDLSENGFTFSMPRWIFDLRKLVSLELSGNHFHNPNPNAPSNLTNLQNLGMSWNNLNTSIPNWLYSCKHLKSLNLEKNKLQGAIREDLGNLSSLAELTLSDNQLSGTLPNTIGKLCNMNFLDLSDNQLEGLISDVIDSMAGCFSYAIQTIDLGGNHFSGQLTNKVGQFKNLGWLDLSNNYISGPIPPNVGLLSSLEILLLDRNKLYGTLPHSLGQLSNLARLDISRNMMEGNVAQGLLENLTSLKYLLASGNSMTLEVDQNWVPPTQYHTLCLGSWKLGPQFPNWIQSQKKINDLDLSFTGISGAIPSWIWLVNMEFSSSNMVMSSLNLSHNQLQGQISTICCFYSIDLSSNQLSGQLPHIASEGIDYLDLSNNSFSGVLSHFLCDHQMDETREMSILKLGNNLLSGEISDCWMNWPSLGAINLDNNNLTGSIPKSIGRLNRLRFLHLRNNSLSGGIPSSMENCTSLLVIDLAENKFDWNIPIWLGLRLLNLRILILRSNKFQGEFTPQLCHLTSLQVLDVANNILSGAIPSCVNNFTSMNRVNFDTDPYKNVTGYTESIYLVTKGNEYVYSIILRLVTGIDLSNNNFSGKIPNELTFLLGLIYLNLSGNQLGGMIPMHIGKMVQLESLDLSRNQLSGSIPSGMSQLSFLSFLNLSYNNLSGEIPLSTQMQSFNASCFAANQLCGRPLIKNCTNDDDDDDDGKTEIEEDDVEGGVDLLYIFMGSGFVVGFWSICFILILKRSWRYAYFHFVDEVWFKICFSITKYLFKR